MLRAIDQYFLKQDEPSKSCLQFLREYILQKNTAITEAWKYGMPFYCYQEKMICYLWIHKKYRMPYIGIVEDNSIHHPDLLVEKRAKMKILLIDAQHDLPMDKIDWLLNEVVTLAARKTLTS